MELLHNQKGVICTVLNERFIFASINNSPFLIQLNQHGKECSFKHLYYHETSNKYSCTFQGEICHLMCYPNPNDDKVNQFFNPIYIWLNGKPFYFEDIEDGTELMCDAIFLKNVGFLAIIVWQGFKPHFTPVLASDELILNQNYFKLSAEDISFRDGIFYVHVAIDDEKKEIPVSHQSVFINGRHSVSVTETHKLLFSSSPLLVSLCRLLPSIHHKQGPVYHCFSISSDNTISFHEKSFQPGSIFLMKDGLLISQDSQKRSRMFYDVHFKQTVINGLFEISFQISGKNYIFNYPNKESKTKVEEGVAHILIEGSTCFLLVTKVLNCTKIFPASSCEDSIQSEIFPEKCVKDSESVNLIEGCMPVFESPSQKNTHHESKAALRSTNITHFDLSFAQEASKKNNATVILPKQNTLQTTTFESNSEVPLTKHSNIKKPDEVPVFTLDDHKHETIENQKDDHKQETIAKHETINNHKHETINNQEDNHKHKITTRSETSIPWISEETESWIQSLKSVDVTLLYNKSARLTKNDRGDAVIEFQNEKNEVNQYKISVNFVFSENVWLDVASVRYPCSVYFDALSFPSINTLFILLLWLDNKPAYAKCGEYSFHVSISGIVTQIEPYIIIKGKVKKNRKLKLSGKFKYQLFDHYGLPYKSVSIGTQVSLMVQRKNSNSEYEIVYGIVSKSSDNETCSDNILQDSIKMHTGTEKIFEYSSNAFTNSILNNSECKYNHLPTTIPRMLSGISEISKESGKQKSSEQAIVNNECNKIQSLPSLTPGIYTHNYSNKSNCLNNLSTAQFLSKYLSIPINTSTKCHKKKVKILLCFNCTPPHDIPGKTQIFDVNFPAIIKKLSAHKFLYGIEIYPYLKQSLIVLTICPNSDTFPSKELSLSCPMVYSHLIQELFNSVEEPIAVKLVPNQLKLYTLTSSSELSSDFSRKPNMFYIVEGKIKFLNFDDGILDVPSYYINATQNDSCSVFCYFNKSVVMLEKGETTNMQTSELCIRNASCYTAVVYQCKKHNICGIDVNFCVSSLWVNKLPKVSFKSLKYILPPLFSELDSQTKDDFSKNIASQIKLEKERIPTEETVLLPSTNSLKFKEFNLSLELVKTELRNFSEIDSRKTKVMYFAVGRISFVNPTEGFLIIPGHYVNVTSQNVFCYFNKKVIFKSQINSIQEKTAIKAIVYKCYQRLILGRWIYYCVSLFWTTPVPSVTSFKYLLDYVYTNPYIEVANILDSSLQRLQYINCNQNYLVQDRLQTFEEATELSESGSKAQIFYFVQGKVTHFDGDFGILSVPSQYPKMLETDPLVLPCIFNKQSVYLVDEKENPIKDAIVISHHLFERLAYFNAVIYHCKNVIYFGKEVNLCALLLWASSVSMPENITVTRILPPLQSHLCKDMSHIWPTHEKNNENSGAWEKSTITDNDETPEHIIELQQSEKFTYPIGLQISENADISENYNQNHVLEPLSLPSLDKDDKKGIVIQVESTWGKFITRSGDVLHFSREKCVRFGMKLQSFFLKDVIRQGNIVTFETNSSGAIEKVFIGDVAHLTAEETFLEIIDWWDSENISEKTKIKLLREFDWSPPSGNPISTNED